MINVISHHVESISDSNEFYYTRTFTINEEGGLDIMMHDHDEGTETLLWIPKEYFPAFKEVLANLEVI